MASWNSRHNADRLLLGLHCSLAAYVEVGGESSALLDTEIMGTVDLGTLSVTFLEGETGGEATYVEVPFHAAGSLDVRAHPKSCVLNLVLENSRDLRDVVVSWTGSLNIVDSLPEGTELSLVLVIGITDERFEEVMGFLGPLLRLPNISVKKQRTSLTTTKNIDGQLERLSQQREQGEALEAPPAKRVSFCRTKMVYEEVSTPEKDLDATQPPSIEAKPPSIEAKPPSIEAKPPTMEAEPPAPEAPAIKRRKKPKSKPKAKPSKKKSKATPKPVTKGLEQVEIVKKDSPIVSPEALHPTAEEVAPTLTAMTLPFEDPPSERTPTERQRAASAPCSPSNEGGLLKRKRRRSIAGASQLLSSPDGIGTGSAQPPRPSDTNGPSGLFQEPPHVICQEPPHVICQEPPQPISEKVPGSKLKRHKPKSAVTKKRAPKWKAKKRQRTPTITQEIIEEDTPRKSATVDQAEQGSLLDEPFQELDIEAPSPLSFSWKQKPQKRRPSMKTKATVNLTPSDLRLSQKSPSHRTLSTEFLAQFTEEVLLEPGSEMAWTQFLSEDELPKVRTSTAVGDMTPLLQNVVDVLGNAFELKSMESLETLRTSHEVDRIGLKTTLNNALSSIDDEATVCIGHLEKEIRDLVKTFKRDIAVVLTQLSEVYGTLEDIEEDDFKSHLSETKRSVEEVVNSLTRRLRKSFNPLDKSSIMQQIKDALGAV
ncbi:MAG: hypothetical protein KVP17_000583 [Porospora cf. gigantea B]|nr:MAG: hypothetical protein KVP17_000583 [Porospora cf. gigantea B]